MQVKRSIERQCESCGRAFWTFLSRIADGRGRFCSRSCTRLPRKSSAERFWPKVAKSDGCWIWTASVGANGYGQIFSKSYCRPQPVHRVSWELHFGPIPDGLWVLHRCDVKLCVRPDHLFLGTHADNMADMAAKGRHGAHIYPERFGRKRKQ